MEQKFFDRTMLKFLLVGMVNTLVGAGTMFLLYNAANCSYWFASAANYAAGGVVSFFLNKYFIGNGPGTRWENLLLVW